MGIGADSQRFVYTFSTCAHGSHPNNGLQTSLLVAERTAVPMRIAVSLAMMALTRQVCLPFNLVDAFVLTDHNVSGNDNAQAFIKIVDSFGREELVPVPVAFAYLMLQFHNASHSGCI